MLTDRYNWVHEEADQHNVYGTFAVAWGANRDDVLAAYGVDPTIMLGNLAFNEAMRRGIHAEKLVLQVFPVGDRLVLLEPASVAGVLPAVARAATRNGGNFISVGNTPSSFDMLEAIDGIVTANFTPNLLDPGDGPPLRRPLVPAWLGQIPSELITDEGWTRRMSYPAAMWVMEWRSGVAFEREWLYRPLPTYTIIDPYVLYDDPNR